MDQVADAVMTRLTLTARPIDAINPPYAGLIGAGRVDVAAAVLLGPAAPRMGDINGDTSVDALDLAMILASWGPCQEPSCAADLNGSGVIDGLDLSMLLSNWG